MWIFYPKFTGPERTYCKVKDTTVPLLHKVKISSIHVLCGHLILIVLWSNPRNYSEMQCWDSGSPTFIPWGCLLDRTKFYWNREKMIKSENLQIQILFWLFLSPNSWIIGLLFSLETFLSWKICGFTTISSHLCSLQDNHNSIWTPCCPIACMLFIYTFSYLSLFCLKFSIFFSISANLIKAKTLQESEKNNYWVTLTTEKNSQQNRECSLCKYEINSTSELRTRLFVLFSIWLRNSRSRKLIMVVPDCYRSTEWTTVIQESVLQSNC